MIINTQYFDTAGEHNTDQTLKIVKEWSDKLGINSIVIATTKGKTGLKAAETLSSKDIIVVSHSTGFKKEAEQELPDEMRKRIENKGITVLTCQHALAGISRAIRYQLHTYQVDEIIANVLRIFGQGMKVAVEIALMAADAGLVPTDKEIISVGGTVRGADTAVVLRPNNVCRFFDLKVRGVLCKPWEI
ncbi:MAG: pyruvate kinase alpha/beta domain-containing protein [bacterium]